MRMPRIGNNLGGISSKKKGTRNAVDEKWGEEKCKGEKTAKPERGKQVRQQQKIKGLISNAPIGSNMN